MKGRIGFLEVDITMNLVRIQEVPDRELQTSLVLHDLFGDGGCPLTQRVDDHLPFYPLCPVKPGKLAGPAMLETKLVIDVQQQRRSAYIDILAIQNTRKFIVVDILSFDN